MEYSILRGRKDLFERTFSYLKKNLLVENCYIKWKKGPGEVTCNSAIDDMRIIRALLDAYNLWGNKEYYDTAGFIQEALFRNQAVNGKLNELYDWKSGSVKNRIPLCYLDLYTMYRLEEFNAGWRDVSERGIYILKDGRIDNTPFFYKYLDYGKVVYLPDEDLVKKRGICLTYTIYSAIHMSEMNEDTEFFTEFLKKEIKNGKLYAWYSPVSLKPSSQLESTAVYALASLYCTRIGEQELSQKLLDNMLRFMVTDKKSPYYGGFGNSKTGEFYSFDNLTALIAIAAAAR
jgi:hypothetical protein